MRPVLLLALLAVSLPILVGAIAPRDRAPVGAASSSLGELADRAPGGMPEADWAGIRAAYETGRHAFREVDGEHRARNPGQRWVTRFDGRGFDVRPDSGAWAWGLELVRYGFAGEQREIRNAKELRSAGQRAAYDWDSTLQEWYVNDARGLEHGYTVHRRPERLRSGEAGPLIFTIAVRGGLLPEVGREGRGVRFRDENGASLLTYTGLIVIDAQGRELPARFEVAGAGMQLLIDERDAHYPLTIDPIAQQAYLKASNTGASDGFASVAIDGDTAVVGASQESSGSTGVNGDQLNNDEFRSGAAYVFVRDGVGWSQQAYLKASNTEASDGFGGRVSISGDTIVVGAIGEDSLATGVNGDQSNNIHERSGAAYVFVRDGTSWSQQAYLKASNTGTNFILMEPESFGSSVSVSGDTIVVGAPNESSNATGVNGDELNDSAFSSGAAYVFVRSGTTWSQQAYLKASNTRTLDFFGRSVSVSGDTILVGANGEDSNASGVNGNELDDSLMNAGAAYVFVRSGTTWSQQAYLKASNPGSQFGTGDGFGGAVSLSGNTAVVTATGEASNATGVDGDQLDNSASRAGAAYVFVRSGAIWSQQAYLKASNTESFDAFGGGGVSISGDTVVVGAAGEDSGATGVDGDQSDNSAVGSGAAYVFARDGTTWSQQAYLKASNTEASDGFGGRVSISGDTIVVGAFGEDSNATGVGGDQLDNSASGSGAVFVFDLNAPSKVPSLPPGVVAALLLGLGAGYAHRARRRS